MTAEQLDAILVQAQASESDEGWSEVAEGRLVTLYAAKNGVGLTVSRVEAVKRDASRVIVRTAKGELFVLELEDLFAGSVDTDNNGGAGRRAGFR